MLRPVHSSNLIMLIGFTLSAFVPMMLTDSLPVDMTPKLSFPSGLAMAADTGAEMTARPVVATGPLPGDVPVVMPVPVGFDGLWTSVLLDGGRLRLQVLKHAYTLSQTRNQAGAEYFDYSAGLFTQMAQQVAADDPNLSRALMQLGAQSTAMGNHVSQAMSLRFDGKPGGDFNHLQVRRAILEQLDPLNAGRSQVVDFDEAGHALSGKSAQLLAVTRGPALNEFMATLSAIRNNPAAQARYPQMLSVVVHQSGVLEQLALNTRLRWESVYNCDSQVTGDCAAHQDAMRMKLYAVQMMPSSRVALASETSIWLWLGASA